MKIEQLLERIPTLPRYVEGGYSPLGRSPVVDALLADPLYMPTYAELVTDLIKKQSEADSVFGLETALWTASGVAISPVSVLHMNEAIPDAFSSRLSDEMARKIYGYWRSFVEIQREVVSLLAPLSENDRSWILRNYEKFFFGQKGSANDDYDFFSTDNPYPFAFFELASRIDLTKLADCARRLSLIADDFYETLQYETLDTGDNYGDNIYAQLKEYLGVDFGLDRQAWIDWWDQAKETFELPPHS